jgi:hypothetical protein
LNARDGLLARRTLLDERETMSETTEEAVKRHERWLFEEEEAFNRHRSWLEQLDDRMDRSEKRMDRMERLFDRGLRRLGALEEQVRRTGEMLERYLGHRGGDASRSPLTPNN